MDAAKYEQPAMQPGFAQLLEQSKSQANDAALAGARQEGNRLEATYGTLTSGDSAALLARYGANLAMASAGGAAALPGMPDPLRKVA